MPTKWQFMNDSPLSCCGCLALKYAMSPSLLPDMPCVMPSPWMSAWITDLPLMNRIWQKQWDVTSEIWLEKDCGFYFVHILSLSLCLPTLSFSHWGKKTKQNKTKQSAALLSNPMEKPRGRRMGVSGQQPAGPEAISPTTLEEPNSADSHRSELGSGSSPYWALGWLQL